MTLGLPKPNVLVVDDEPMVVEVVGRYLRRDGFAVVTASTGPEGLKAALDAEHPPHVIVLDVMLPGMECDLLHHLFAHPGEVFSRADLLAAVWDQNFVGGPATVTVHIRRLREKIERDPSRPSHLKVVWGTGYKFDPSA